MKDVAAMNMAPGSTVNTRMENRILLVEDDATLAEELVTGLSRWGFSVRVPTRFEDVVREFTAFDPHLVLLDVNLPRYDGFWWCTRIRELSRVPVVFLSSRDSQMDIVMAVNAGADDYITKPFSMAVLVAKVQAVMRRAYAWSDMSSDWISRGGRVVCRDKLMELLWNDSIYVNDNTLTANMTRLCAKLEELGLPGFIETRKGQGYCIP